MVSRYAGTLHAAAKVNRPDRHELVFARAGGAVPTLGARRATRGGPAALVSLPFVSGNADA